MSVCVCVLIGRSTAGGGRIWRDWEVSGISLRDVKFPRVPGSKKLPYVPFKVPYLGRVTPSAPEAAIDLHEGGWSLLPPEAWLYSVGSPGSSFPVAKVSHHQRARENPQQGEAQL